MPILLFRTHVAAILINIFEFPALIDPPFIIT